MTDGPLPELVGTPVSELEVKVLEDLDRVFVQLVLVDFRLVTDVVLFVPVGYGVDVTSL